MKNSHIRKLAVLFLLLLFTGFLAVTKGSVSIPLQELLNESNRPILYLRIARVMMAVIAGGGLAVSGAALQAILRNPLAEPYLLGTSSGAGLGAVIALLIGLNSVFLPFSAFTGAILSVIIVYNLARQGNKIPTDSLILSGVIVSIALSAILVFLVSVSADDTLHGIIWWLWGSLQVYDLRLLITVGGIVVTGIIALFFLSQDLNAITLGEEEAIHLGIKTETIKKTIFFITSFITASIVCISGIIGFVGLIVPHAMRFIVGPNHKILIPTSCIAAAIFMITCDMIGRALMPPMEIPIGVVTAITGAPVFIIIFKKSHRRT